MQINREAFERELRHVVAGRNPALELGAGLYTRQEVVRALLHIGVGGHDVNTILTGCVQDGLLRSEGEPPRFRLMVRYAAQGNA